MEIVNFTLAFILAPLFTNIQGLLVAIIFQGHFGGGTDPRFLSHKYTTAFNKRCEPRISYQDSITLKKY